MDTAWNADAPARLATSDDLAAVQQLWAQAFPEEEGSHLPVALAEGRCLLVVEQGAAHSAVAAVLASSASQLPGERRLVVAVARSDQQLEHWATAERAARRWMLEEGVRRWHVVVREDDAVPVTALGAAGYEVTARSWGASLRVAAVDAPVWRRFVQAAERAAFTMRRLTEADAPALHGLVWACREDFPVTPATPAPEPALPEIAAGLRSGSVVAHGAFTSSGELVAATSVELSDEPPGTVADVEQTVVARSARRRGLATAVKALSVLELGVDAGPQGVVEFRTGGAQVNEASLRANRAVGYVLEPLWLTWTSGPTG
ncbi:hypothetical protein SAMN06264364_13215 [Quadrisphaera granulorum]|uniref:N-acetyltransferase domain-containing protein n=1 Tax=Quadrisphaera granulorum TaxID=317664 RepID=A0A315ZTD3_9ACTN|nr:hypothetical protein [Quadrisphaera granulorum]PWJ48138.1 hypothetical protein BXY45_13215 [Quadrisphaera granulorum]SZE98507.1 hypothetical protein SAMN06264364_13215 [Quadrisphaera granulorum]